MKYELDVHKQLLLINSCSGYCQVISRSTTIIFSSYTKHLSVSFGISVENSVHIITSTAVNLEFTGQDPLSVFRSKQTRAGSVNQFHLLL